MTSEADIPDDERLARFILDARCIRANGGIKPDAFIPSPHTELSVTRRASLTTQEIWERGEQVAASRKKPLIGKACVFAKDVRTTKLEVVPHPLPGNPEHASIRGWLPDKSQQKMVAQLLAMNAKYCKCPATEPRADESQNQQEPAADDPSA